MNNNKICVYAICKNEIKFVDKWLNSMQEADYIVVLDTGSSDGTFEKLQQDPRVTLVKQEVINPWRFDVARNKSMELVPSDANILVCTDFDEVFEPGWADVLRKIWKKDTTRVYYRYAWSHNSQTGEPEIIFNYDKIHDKNFYWKFPCHEVVTPKEGFKVNAIYAGESIFLHHYPDNTKSRAWYFPLIKLSVEENPDNSHVRLLLAREYLNNNDLDNALKEFLNTLEMKDVSEENRKSVLLYSLYCVANIYYKQGNYDEVIWYCQEFIKEDHTYREPYLLLASVYNAMHMYSLAEAMINSALEYATRKYSWVEFPESWGSWLYDELSVSQFYLGKIDESIDTVNKALSYNPDDLGLNKNKSCFLDWKVKQLNSHLEARKLSKCIGIISYLPDDDNLRKQRLFYLNNLIKKCNELFNLPIIIIAQNWKENEVKISSNCSVYSYQDKLGITQAREALRKVFLTTSYEYIIMLDDDSVIEGNDSKEYLTQIDDNPYGYCTFNGQQLRLFAISRYLYEKVKIPKVSVEKIKGYKDGFEDVAFVECLRKNYPQYEHHFINTKLKETASNVTNKISTWDNDNNNKRELYSKSIELYHNYKNN